MSPSVKGKSRSKWVVKLSSIPKAQENNLSDEETDNENNEDEDDDEYLSEEDWYDDKESEHDSDN